MSSAARLSRESTPGDLRGVVYIALAAIFWGISASLGRAAFTERLLPGSGIRNINPVVLSQARTSFSFIVVFAILWLRRGLRYMRLPKQDLKKLLVLGLAGVAASNYFYYLAIQRTNVATAIIIQYTAPVWVLLYMVVRRVEKITAAKLISVLLAIAGIGLVIGVFNHGKLQLDSVGVMAALLAAFSFSFYNIGGHSLLARYDRWLVLMFTTLAASLFWMAINPPTKILAAHYSNSAWAFLFIFAILSVLLPFSFYFHGLQHLSPTKAIIASCLEPVFTILIAAAALREVIGAVQAVGIVMVLSAIVLVQRPAVINQAPLEPVD